MYKQGGDIGRSTRFVLRFQTKWTSHLLAHALLLKYARDTGLQFVVHIGLRGIRLLIQGLNEIHDEASKQHQILVTVHLRHKLRLPTECPRNGAADNPDHQTKDTLKQNISFHVFIAI
jgi:hypothetical protein